MPMRPETSVVIPLFNKAPYVKRAIDSVLAQTYRDFELIIVDDGSTDGSAELAAEYADERVTLMSQENAGPGAARNRGVSASTGNLLAFLDADDEWKPGFLAEAVKALSAAPDKVAAVALGHTIHGEAPRAELERWKRLCLEEAIYEPDPATLGKHFDSLLMHVQSWSTVIRKDAFKRHAGFYAKDRCVYGEDTHLWLRIILNETVAVRRESHTIRHLDASDLSFNLGGPPPLPPFLSAPAEVFAACPCGCEPILRRFLGRCASHHALIYSLFGQSDEAESLLRSFPEDRITTRRAAARLISAIPCLAGTARAAARIRSRLRHGRAWSYDPRPASGS